MYLLENVSTRNNQNAITFHQNLNIYQEVPKENPQVFENEMKAGHEKTTVIVYEIKRQKSISKFFQDVSGGYECQGNANLCDARGRGFKEKQHLEADLF